MHQYVKHLISGMVLFATLAMPLQSHAIILPRTPHVKNGYHPLLPYYLLIKWLKGIENDDLTEKSPKLKRYFRELLQFGNLQTYNIYNDVHFKKCVAQAIDFTKGHKKEIAIVVAVAVTIALAVIVTVSLVEATKAISTVGALTAAATEVLAGDDRPRGPNEPGLSPEEKGKILASLLVHDQIEKADLPPEVALSKHQAIDEFFSTNYTPCCSDEIENPSLSARYYQSTAQKAYESGYYQQTHYDSNKAIELSPSYSEPYFDRSLANFKLGEYDAAISDYHTYVTQTQGPSPFSTSEFSAGFAKGFPKGVYDSGEALFEFASSAVTHPIQTGQQVCDSLTLLADLAREQEWSTLAETLAPEVHQLITEWDNLSSTDRGELAGYAFGKYGADIVIPGAAGKAVIKGTKVAKTLKQARAGCEIAERALVLEAATGAELEIVAEALESTPITKRPSIEQLPNKSKNYIKSKPIKAETSQPNLNIQWDKQGKHLTDHRNYIDTRSVLTHPDPQKLIRDYAGTGQKANKHIPGTPGYREIVDFKEIIGYSIDEVTGVETPTTWGKIYYAKDGVHIVPTNPRIE